MDRKAGSGAASSRRLKRVSKTPLYFYINDNLHRRLQINRGANEMTTWCYPLARRITYTYTDAKLRMQPAFRTVEVAAMLMRSKYVLEEAIIEGNIEPPQFTYGLESGNKYKYMWAEKDIMAAHAYFSTVHRGRKRKDGLITPQKLPTPLELRSMIRGDTILYVQNEFGEFVPTWKAEEF